MINRNLLALFLLVILFTNCTQQYNDSPRIQPWEENPRYWQYKGKPVLLLGGSNNDNLFQSPDVKEQLDLLQSVGGNFVRNVMSSRDSGDVWPFLKLENGKYDLNQWNENHWQKFENLLNLAEERDIIVQIEIWDRFDYSNEPWSNNPFNPANNINYTEAECGMAFEYPEHPISDVQPFFHTVEGLPHYSPVLELVKTYQKKYIDKMLSISFQYGNVLYCANNETNTPPEWGRYWMQYIKDKAGDRTVFVTDMFGYFYEPNACEVCRNAISNPEEYMFLDISQINAYIFGQDHWDTLQWIVNERNKYTIRPINCTKVYGGMSSSWGSGTAEDGVERFFRNVIGGCAAVRHHRPDHGNGMNEKALASIKAVRNIEKYVSFWNLSTQMNLLKNRESNEAYVTCNPGEQYVIYFTRGGDVRIDLKDFDFSFSLNWISIENGEIGEEKRTIKGGNEVAIKSPDNKGWFAVLIKSD